jgi:hypothetical protein|tara:strand:+ start:34 stop:336 length:303 start_codon:yes stop_codon:yes gene_type:complete
VNKPNPIVICLVLTIAFSIPSILKIPMMMPFLDSAVRAKAPQAIENLRKEGIWMVNTELKSVTKEEDQTCFHFEHTYTLDNRTRKPNPKTEPETRTTCLK